MALKVNGPKPNHENVLVESLRVKTISSSSCMKGSQAKNVLLQDDSTMWMSEPGIP